MIRIHLILFVVVVIVMLVAISIQVLAKSHPVPNKYRYSTNNQYTQTFEKAPDIYHESLDASQAVNKYRINRDLTRMGSENHLDAEDESILKKFYQETRQQDPFSDESFSSQNLWDELQDQDLANALLDVNLNPRADLKSKISMNHEAPTDDWTIDSTLLGQAQKLAKINDNSRGFHDIPHKSASYSPTIKLLTAYNPIENSGAFGGSDTDYNGQHQVKQRDRIVGATLFGRDEHAKPNVGSKSPVDAIKMHNELLQEPPKDGKVRVRMYFHRAIHDDAKLYGNGPWKYWGHGWGIEFGYDPRADVNKDFYQRGYTIERAFGRDFCLDQKNCRPPDPNFLKTQQHIESLHRLKRQKSS